MMTINATSIQRGTRVSTPRPCAGYAAPVASVLTSAPSVVTPFGAQLDTTGVWGDVRVDGHIAATGQPAWSPPI
ncbi:hypothetical protein J2S63_001185 [Marmoricola bigeumensis]|jgi:hypothetical protein|uniref:Uncharacterized protein n=1 Tax=Nocardioides marmoribigeumensis TaxID=433649 RepID=A0ABU2BSM5_9ACTN|nr:hypothetical protein [Nocardioides marmoribigeumensis]